jgi:hypothetical protein
MALVSLTSPSISSSNEQPFDSLVGDIALALTCFYAVAKEPVCSHAHNRVKLLFFISLHIIPRSSDVASPKNRVDLSRCRMHAYEAFQDCSSSMAVNSLLQIFRRLFCCGKFPETGVVLSEKSKFLIHLFILFIYLFKSDKGQLTATNISQRLKLSKSSF